MVAALFMNGGAGPWTAAGCGAVAREARSAAWRWTGGPGGTRGRPIPSRTHEQEDLGGPRRTLEDLGGNKANPPSWFFGRSTFHIPEDPKTEGLGNQLLGPKKED